MNGKSYKWLMKSLGSLSLASAVVLLPMILAGCGEDSSSSTVPLPPPPPPAPPPAPPAPPAPPPTPAPTPTPTGSVISISPADGTTNVATTTSIVIRFSEPVREAPFTNALRIESVAPQQGTVPSRTLEFNSDRTQVTVTFATPLTNDAVYRVTVRSDVPDLFASGRRLAGDFVATFTTGNVAAPGGPVSVLATQLAAVTPNGQVFSNPNVIPVGFGIRRAGVAENLPVGVYTDYRAVLSFPIPASIPSNAVVQTARLTLVQLPSNDSATISGFGDVGRGFFFLDPTPHNVPANNVVFQEVTLGSANNVISNDFFAPASTPSFIALSINGNVLGGDVSAGPRTADVASGVQRAVSGSRFYQVRLQCAREVWNNQAAPVFLVTTGTASVTTTGIVTATQRFNVTATQTFAIAGTASAVFTNTVSGAVTLPITQSITFTGTISGSAIATRTDESTFSFSVTTSVTFSATQLLTAGFGATATISGFASASVVGTVVGSETRSENVTVTGSVTASATTAVTPFTVTSPNPGLEISQGSGGVCRAEFDREPATGTGAQPITTARGPRLDITFTIPR